MNKVIKANSPEKIYLSAIDLQEVGNFLTETNDKDDVEYTRTDTFIEKACAFLKDRIEHDSIDYPMATHYLIDDFKKYMGV